MGPRLKNKFPLEGIKRGAIMRYQLSVSSRLGRPVSCEGVLVDIQNSPIPPQLQRKVASGRYEGAERRLINDHLPRTNDIIELGAGIGVVAATIDKVLHSNVTQVAVEPNKIVLPTLQRTIELNDADVELIQAAYSPSSSQVALQVPDLFTGGTTSDSGEGQIVDGVSLRDITERFEITEFSLVADIEGAEYQLFSQEYSVLKDHCPRLIVELHPAKNANNSDCILFDRDDFNLIEGISDVYVFKNTKF